MLHALMLECARDQFVDSKSAAGVLIKGQPFAAKNNDQRGVIYGNFLSGALSKILTGAPGV